MAFMNPTKGYWIAIKGDLLPVTPSSVKVSVQGRNETLDLIDGSQINVLKAPGLSEISFDFMIPHCKYPFVKVDVLKPVKYYINLFEELMNNKQPFDYILSRNTPEGRSIYATVLNVSCESFSYEESAENGLDVMASIVLKVYKPYGTRVLSAEENTGSEEAPVVLEENTIRSDSRDIPQYYTVQPGDSLWKICKNFFDDGGRYSEIASINGIANPNLIYTGQKLKLYE